MQISQSSVASFAAARANGLEAMVQLLFDRAEIADIVRRYAQAIDTRDHGLLRTCYTDEIEMDFSPTVDGMTQTHFTADEWVEMVFKFHGQLTATEHILVPEGIDVQGDIARCYAVMHAGHFKREAHGSPNWLIAGSYDMSFTRTADGWKMHQASQIVRWVEGNWHNHLEAARALREQAHD
jgi:ketosteroid isomerase-like protein